MKDIFVLEKQQRCVDREDRKTGQRRGFHTPTTDKAPFINGAVAVLVDHTHTWRNGLGILRPRRQENTIDSFSGIFERSEENRRMIKAGRPGEDEVLILQLPTKHRSWSMKWHFW